MLRYGLAPNVLLNVNVPYLPWNRSKASASPARGCAFTMTRWTNASTRAAGPYYWTVGDLPTGVPERGTDIGALAEGCVSVTPIQLDLTAYHLSQT